MSLIIQKFGGTSVADKDRICSVAEIIARTIKANNSVIAVVSAMAGSTNALISKCASVSKLTSNSSLREYDAAVSSGEIITAAMLSLRLETIGIKARSLQGWQVPILTNNNHRAALINKIDTAILKKLLREGITPVITGFQGISEENELTTLGKGGSDTTAAMVAAAIKADRCDIYTDVEGIYSADPRIVENTKKIDEISHVELVELCSSGAKVLHPRAALAAQKYNIKMQILSSFTDKPGTIVTKNKADMENGIITAITSDKNILISEIEADNSEKMIEVMAALSARNILVNHSEMSGNRLSLTIDLSDHARLEEELENLKLGMVISNFQNYTDRSAVSLIGLGLKSQLGLMNDVINGLKNLKIFPTRVMCSENNITIIMTDSLAEMSLKYLHEQFILPSIGGK